MFQVFSVILAVCYGLFAGGFRLYQQVADIPTGPYLPESSAGESYNVFVVGTWYNADDLREKWVFSEDGVLTVGGEKREYSVTNSFEGKYIVIDGRKYNFYAQGNWDRLSLEGEDHSVIVLYSADSEYYQAQMKELERKERLETECAELFRRYPDKNGWSESVNCGDIPFLADADYIDQCLNGDGIFRVNTPEQLASFCWYVNTQAGGSQYMFLEADIDLSGYEWAPMGWAEGDMPFSGYVDGGGHTIKNMTIDLDTAGSCAGFIGWETWCAVVNIRFEGAKVSGGYAGVVTGQAIGGSYYGITITDSEVEGHTAGSMLGWDANTSKKECSADVVVNGERFDFLSYNESEKSKIVIENPVEITIDDDHTVTRPEVEGYINLGWLVTLDGEQVLHRNAENEYSYTYFGRSPGYYEICLTAFVSGQYVPISNTVSYTLE
ncbi:MAG: hypothetical protein ACI4WS_05355 [Oscillospiraceae bacterium]